MTLLSESRIGAASFPATRWELLGAVENGRYIYRKKGGGKREISKREKRDYFVGQNIFFCGERNFKHLIMQIASLSSYDEGGVEDGESP